MDLPAVPVSLQVFENKMISSNGKIYAQACSGRPGAAAVKSRTRIGGEDEEIDGVAETSDFGHGASRSSIHFIAAPITLTNGTTQIRVNGGEANNGLVPYDGYFRYTDLGAAEETSWSIDPFLRFSDGSTTILSNGAAGGFGSPSDIGGGVVRSTASVTSLVDVTADTELVGSNARTTFSFTDLSGSGLGGTSFVFYTENDLFGFANDAAAFTGSIAGDDLALFMFDSAAGGLSVRLTGEDVSGADLDLFGAGIWPAWGTALESGDLSVLSSDGSNFAILGDLGLALGFSLSGSSATVVINYDTQPEPPGIPEPSTVALIGLGIAGIALRRRKTGRS